MPLNRDEINTLADTHYDSDVYETRDQQLFALLVDVAGACYESYLDTNKPDIEDPDSFKPQTLGGVPLGFAMIQGLKENLEMNYPDIQLTFLGME